VVCPRPFTVLLNGIEVASSDGGANGIPIVLEGIDAGENTLLIHAEDATAILAEGSFAAEYGADIPIFTDATWETAVEGAEWTTAWEYVAPPEAPFGEPLHPWVDTD